MNIKALHSFKVSFNTDHNFSLGDSFTSLLGVAAGQTKRRLQDQ